MTYVGEIFRTVLAKSEFEELVNCRNLASPCEGEGDRLRWRGRKTCGNVCKIDLSVILLRKMTAPLIEGEPSASFNSSLQIPIDRAKSQASAAWLFDLLLCFHGDVFSDTAELIAIILLRPPEHCLKKL